LMVLCFIGSPARRRIGYAARETAARRERVHARDTEKDRERERASEPASDRRTRLRSVALEDQPEKHSMGQDSEESLCSSRKGKKVFQAK
jgi:hypothetical protein